MIGRSSLWLPLVLLLFLAGISFWLSYTVQRSGSVNTRHDSDPETIVENFEAVRTDELGRIKERLSARKLTHYSGSGQSVLEGPQLMQISPDAANMTAISERATISHDSNEISMEKNVQVIRAATPQEGALTFTTQRLLVYREHDLLRAPEAVSIQGPGLDITAARMDVHSKQRIIKLSGRVKARYQNAKR